jgi:hypothetical protein
MTEKHKLSEVKVVSITGLKVHSLNTLRPMKGEEFESFKKNIGENGQQVPIVLLESKVLSGRNRLNALDQLGKTEIKAQEYLGTDPLGYIKIVDVDRRHLNEGQRAMAAARLCTLEKGANQYTPKDGFTILGAAKEYNISPASVDRAKRILKSGNEKLIEEVEDGVKSVTAADDELKVANQGAAPTGNGSSGTGKTVRGKGSGKGGRKSSTKLMSAADADNKIRETWPALDDVRKQNLLRHIIIDWVGWKRVSEYLSPEFEIVDRRAEPQAEAAERNEESARPQSAGAFFLSFYLQIDPPLDFQAFVANKKGQ